MILWSRLSRTALAGLAAVLCLAAWSPARAAELDPGPAPVRLHTFFGWGDETDSQYIFLSRDLFKLIMERMGRRTEHRHFTVEKNFFKSVETDAPEFIMVGSRVQVARLLQDHGYIPFASYKLYGMDRYSSCIMVDRDSEATGLEDLRGGTIAFNNSEFEYSLLREVVGERPEEFFSEMKPTVIGPASVYSYRLEGLDALFISEQIIRYMEQFNPGIVRGLRILACSYEYAFMPILASPDTPEELREDSLKLLSDMVSGAIKTGYLGFFRMHRAVATPACAEDYADVIERSADAREKGWIDDYRKWLLSVSE